jgi:hypothetical protein
MPSLDPADIQSRLQVIDQTTDPGQRGLLLEQLVERVISTIPGVKCNSRRTRTAFNSEEIDLGFWNSRAKRGLAGLEFPELILVECKNWSRPVGSMEVCWFLTKLKRRSFRFGILVAMNGITGDGTDLSEAHEIVAYFLQHEVRLVVITRSDLEQLKSGGDLVNLIKRRLATVLTEYRLHD